MPTDLENKKSCTVADAPTPSESIQSTGNVIGDSKEDDYLIVDSMNTRQKALTFPQKLMQVLSHKQYEPIISWLPHGKSFTIHNTKAFVADLLPKHFKQAKYSSFTRKLRRWGFQSTLRGEETGAFYHKFFLRDKKEACLKMTCSPASTKSSPILKPMPKTDALIKDLALPRNNVGPVQRWSSRKQLESFDSPSNRPTIYAPTTSVPSVDFLSLGDPYRSQLLNNNRYAPSISIIQQLERAKEASHILSVLGSSPRLQTQQDELYNSVLAQRAVYDYSDQDAIVRGHLRSYRF